MHPQYVRFPAESKRGGVTDVLVMCADWPFCQDCLFERFAQSRVCYMELRV